MALPVGTTRTLTCRFLASPIPAMRDTPRYTIPRLILGIPASGSNITGLRFAAGEPRSGRGDRGIFHSGGTAGVRRTGGRLLLLNEMGTPSPRREQPGDSLCT